MNDDYVNNVSLDIQNNERMQNIIKRLAELKQHSLKLDERLSKECGIIPAAKNGITRIFPFLQKNVLKNSTPLEFIYKELQTLVNDLIDVLKDMAEVAISEITKIETLNKERDQLRNKVIDITELREYIATQAGLPFPQEVRNLSDLEVKTLTDDQKTYTKKILLESLDNIIEMKCTIIKFLSRFITVGMELYQRAAIQKAQLTAILRQMLSIREASRVFTSLDLTSYRAKIAVRGYIDNAIQTLDAIIDGAREIQNYYICDPATITILKQQNEILKNKFNTIFVENKDPHPTQTVTEEFKIDAENLLKVLN